MDESWHLDRKHGGNRSLNETDIRKALIDSRFHRNEESAKECCYNSSEFSRTETCKGTKSDRIYGPDPHIDLLDTKENIIPQSKWFPSETSDPSAGDTQNIRPHRRRLDRSDGTNRSLNFTEIEKQPSAPIPMYPPIPFNPFFSNSPLPIHTPPYCNNDLTLGELMEIERREEEEANYNHKF